MCQAVCLVMYQSAPWLGHGLRVCHDASFFFFFFFGGGGSHFLFPFNSTKQVMMQVLLVVHTGGGDAIFFRLECFSFLNGENFSFGTYIAFSEEKRLPLSHYPAYVTS